jgi:DNA-binding transcriptional MerR regulator
MFKIGEFARLSHVSVKTLHHYDDIGLFKPTWTDPATGYRYYSMEQLPYLKQILALKDLGLTLDEVARALTAMPSAEDLGRLLRAKQAELLGRIREDQRRLARIDAYLSDGWPVGWFEPYSVHTVSAPEVLIAAIRTRIPYGAVHHLHCELRDYLHQQGTAPAHPHFTLFYPDDGSEGWLDVEAAVRLDGLLPATGRVSVRALPPAERLAHVCHRGSHGTLYRAYEALGQWIESNGYRSGSPWREVYVRDEGTTLSPEGYITEVYIPFEPW